MVCKRLYKERVGGVSRSTKHKKQFKEIENFFVTMPKLSHKVTVVNPNTKVKSEVVLEGVLSKFFLY